MNQLVELYTIACIEYGEAKQPSFKAEAANRAYDHASAIACYFVADNRECFDAWAVSADGWKVWRDKHEQEALQTLVAAH